MLNNMDRLEACLAKNVMNTAMNVSVITKFESGLKSRGVPPGPIKESKSISKK